MTLCILLTSHYPYGVGETFLENEIAFLALKFDQVIIFASSAGRDEKMTRQIPENVISYALGEINNKLRYVIYGLRGLLVMPEDERLETMGLPIKYKLGCYYMAGRENLTASKISTILDKSIDWNKVKQCVFYSYWLTDSALVAGRLKAKYGERVKGHFKAVSRAHRYDIYESRNLLGFFPFRNLQLEMLDMVAPCSDDGTRHLVNRYPVFSSKIMTQRLGTRDMGICHASRDDSTVRIVSCSNIIPLKRVEMIAEAVLFLHREGIDIRWTCMGDGPELEKIKVFVHSRGIDAFVEFKGRISNSEVYDFYKNNYVDVFVNASTTEGLPVSIMEAMSFGIPCVATDVGGTGELVNQECGCLLPPDIIASDLANAICNVVGRVHNGEPLRMNARKTWKDIASEDNYAKWLTALSDLY